MINKKYYILLFILIIVAFSLFNKKTNNTNKTKIIRIDVKSALKIKDCAIIDVRDKRFFLNERIKGAFSYPINEIEKWKYLIKSKFKYNKKILLYCDSEICGLADYAAEMFSNLGYTQIFVLKGGIDEWRNHGAPIKHSQSY